MFEKNVPGWERGIRVIGGGLLVLAGIGLFLVGQPLWGSLVGVSGLGFCATALSGWCPMCAMMGRKLPPSEKRIHVQKL